MAEELRWYLAGLPAGWGSIGNTWAEHDPLQLVSAGTDIQNRLGRQIYVERLELRGTLVGGQSNIVTDDAYNTFRIVIASYKGAIGPITPLGTAGIPLHYPILQGLLTVEKVYYDKTIVVASPGRDSTGYMPASRYIRITVPIKRLYNYSQNAASTGMDHLVISCISDSAGAPNPGWNSLQIIPYFRG